MDKQPTISRRVSTGTRVYYFDVFVDQKGDPYIEISEIPTAKTPGRGSGRDCSSTARTLNVSQRRFRKYFNTSGMRLADDILVRFGLSCPYCGAPTLLVDDSEIYGRSFGSKCYVCRRCDAWVGCHKDSDRALGRIANKELRRLKHEAHEVFDHLWLDGHMKRRTAYKLMSEFFDLPLDQTHIGMFDEEMCRKVITLSKITLTLLSEDGKTDRIRKVSDH